ncbi:hypothetical protein CLAFUW4_12902 [Fulvia fulva]|uniref:Uncharacterized protein n=1 Tax=Passalora fulva TaxID=5499 RepID=A0A9Q8PJZ2_PASFU|nr:uncharacterized protein CLAFUR5_12768 [Fulvia fulva]KAK4611725.1 hypothetical protein CLAFUR4_12906 [Fulvia fulva]KAK4612720.1 hypothetical protein CLAFUR0_12912 [Fulvia fulva]UJO23880.1 hypothetical protein CLAFUR5_12768 [Fulvia fulva]WPV21462.1 hypothetical protein CLAFUW4_12902 [Fulvia fulva]WPV35783.1 hypothetical protein CLAFUW7_12909 [Fulvia fulva]
MASQTDRAQEIGKGETVPPHHREVDSQNAHRHNPAADAAMHDEKQAKRQSYRDSEKSIVAPNGSAMPTSTVLRYLVTLRKPTLDFWTITISPERPSPAPPSWQLVYSTTRDATMHRKTPCFARKASASEIATIKFPKVVWPGCGPTITFQPHEAEIEERGARHVSPTDRFMACTGWLSTTYGIDLPALSGVRVEWKTSTDQGAVAAAVGSPPVKTPSEIIHEKQPEWVGPHDNAEGSGSYGDRDPRTPFPTQVLAAENSDKILAAYTRSAPWAKHSGILTIPQSDTLTEHLIEDIVVICAAMVGMQDRIGLTSALIESGYDNIVRGKGKSWVK